MEQIDFLATDGVKLNGFIYKNIRQETKKVILSIHGMSSNCFKKRESIIANYANSNEIDYFCFNNRGSELVRYIKKCTEGKEEKILGGTTYEDVLEGYEDILGAILKLKELGYQEIYLQGHSLGCTKIVYTYNKLKNEEHDVLNHIKGIILLSLIDIPMTLKFYLKDAFEKYVKLAEQKEREGKIYELMPKESFIHPISVKAFLRYARDNEEFDFARYGKEEKLEKLNNIDKPLFMRWGNEREMILQKADELTTMVTNIIKNENKDINYINGANHSYDEKEEVLAEQIIKFINQYK